MILTSDEQRHSHSALINDVRGARRGESRIRIVTFVCGMILIFSDKLQTSVDDLRGERSMLARLHDI